VRFTGERFEMGYLLDAAAGGWRVQLDDGRELVAQIGNTMTLYQFKRGERVCVSFAPGREPELTGYLT
jgi:hypothetical protein